MSDPPARRRVGSAQIELKKLAEMAGCTPGNIRRLHRAGRMPKAAGKIGQTYVWDDTEELRTWLATPRPGGRPSRDRQTPFPARLGLGAPFTRRTHGGNDPDRDRLGGR